MSNEEKKRDIGKQIREEAFSIPNLLSYFRLLLIPVLSCCMCMRSSPRRL